MKKMTELGIRTSFLVLWLCSLTFSVYAITPQVLSKDAGENSPVPSVPATGSENAKGGTLPEQKPASSNDFLHGVSPLSNSNIQPSSSNVGPSLTFGVKQPTKQETDALVDQVLSRMVDAGLGGDLSKVLDYISAGDYAGLTDLLKSNPEILKDLMEAIGKFSESNSASPSSQEYAKDWLVEAQGVRKKLLRPEVGHDSLVEAVAKLYKPIEERISKITDSLEGTDRGAGHQNGDASSENFLKDFSRKAREFILDSLNQAQANLANGALSNPLEKSAFAAETAPILTSGDAVGASKMTVAELYASNKQKQYRVIDSVYIGKDFIQAQKMLHPPANLHPYLKWLLYTRNLTPRMVDRYLETREAAMALYMRAKEGQGNIRYKGQVYGAFLPFAETAAGNFELVKAVSGQ